MESGYLGGQSESTANACPSNLYKYSGERRTREGMATLVDKLGRSCGLMVHLEPLGDRLLYLETCTPRACNKLNQACNIFTASRHYHSCAQVITAL